MHIFEYFHLILVYVYLFFIFPTFDYLGISYLHTLKYDHVYK